MGQVTGGVDRVEPEKHHEKGDGDPPRRAGGAACGPDGEPDEHHEKRDDLDEQLPQRDHDPHHPDHDDQQSDRHAVPGVRRRGDDLGFTTVDLDVTARPFGPAAGCTPCRFECHDPPPPARYPGRFRTGSLHDLCNALPNISGCMICATTLWFMQ